MSDATNNSKAPLIIILLLIIAGFGGYLFYTQQTPYDDVTISENPATTSASLDSETETITEGEIAAESEADSSLPFEPARELSGALSTEEALQVRTLGDVNAPITIIEHSSLTCPHCANFHETTFGELKETYVDTGEVKIVFDDFPLNGPALDGTMVARCLPQDRYFGYIQFLFKNQKDWAFKNNYIAFLKQSSQLAGLSPEGFKDCLANEELRQGLMDRIAQNQRDSNVSSTPTFIFSNGQKITGSQPFSVFEEIIDGMSGGAADDGENPPAAHNTDDGTNMGASE